MNKTKPVPPRSILPIIGVFALLASFGIAGYGVLKLVFSGQDSCDWERAQVPANVVMNLVAGSYDISLEHNGAKISSIQDEIYNSITVSMTTEDGKPISLESNRYGVYRLCGKSGAWAWSFTIPTDGRYRVMASPKSGWTPREPVTIAVSRDRTRAEILAGLIPIIFGGVLMFVGVALVLIPVVRAQSKRRRMG